MAYKPKYAQQGVKKKGVVRQTPQKAAPQKKKMSKGVFILFVILGIFIVPLSTFATGKILISMSQNIARPKAAVVKTARELALQNAVKEFVDAELASARDVLINGEKPVIDELEEAVEKKIYWIEEDVQVAPEPNQENFGRAYSPDEYQAVLERARLILDGQKTYFQPDQQLYADSVVRYYLDETMFAITWQEVHDDSVYTFSEIKVNHPSQFRRHLAGGEYGSDMQYLTTEMAETVNAVVASAGDFYRFRDFGAVVYQGEAKRVEGTYAETCYIDANGDMHFTYGGDVLTVEDVQTFVDALPLIGSVLLVAPIFCAGALTLFITFREYLASIMYGIASVLLIIIVSLVFEVLLQDRIQFPQFIAGPFAFVSMFAIDFVRVHDGAHKKFCDFIDDLAIDAVGFLLTFIGK